MSLPAAYQHQVPARPSALPVVRRAYHEFYRSPRFRWWRPLAAIGMLLALGVVTAVLFSLLGMSLDLATGSATLADYQRGVVTPMLFLANNLALASWIGVAYFTHWAVFGQRPGWLASITGRFRWRVFLRFVAVIVPIYLALYGLEIGALGAADGLSVNPDTWFLLAVILLTTPLQAAGEEFMIRGVLSRSLGSWFSSRRVGLVVSTAVTSIVFASLHGAGDPWLNVFYLGFGVAACYLTWRTGGLEASISVHVVNNLFATSLLPFTGVEHAFDREAGAGSPWVLVLLAVLVGAVAVIVWQARSLALPRTQAPAAPAVTV